MKITKSLISAISATLLVTASISEAARDRTLILLQENTGDTFINDYVDGPLEDGIVNLIDDLAEGFETFQTELIASGKYQRFVNLSDRRCTRANLLSQLIRQSRDGYDTDLLVYGHGSPNRLVLNRGSLFGGARGNLRSMLQDARRITRNTRFNFKLRMVYMCNCWGSSLNDDWRAIGAKVSVGSRYNNYMPEPMINVFLNKFVHEQRTVAQAASESFNVARALWTPIYGSSRAPAAHCYGNAQCLSMSKINQSFPLVSGNRNLIYDDELQLAVNQSKTVRVYANQLHRFADVHMVAGQRYRLTATGTWRNGWRSSSANGYLPAFGDVRRHNNYNTMALVGEYYNKNRNIFSYANSKFRVGTSRTLTSFRTGFLNLIANDAIVFNNSGSVLVTIRRTQ